MNLLRKKAVWLEISGVMRSPRTAATAEAEWISNSDAGSTHAADRGGAIFYLALRQVASRVPPLNECRAV